MMKFNAYFYIGLISALTFLASRKFHLFPIAVDIITLAIAILGFFFFYKTQLGEINKVNEDD